MRAADPPDWPQVPRQVKHDFQVAPDGSAFESVESAKISFSCVVGLAQAVEARIGPKVEEFAPFFSFLALSWGITSPAALGLGCAPSGTLVVGPSDTDRITTPAFLDFGL